MNIVVLNDTCEVDGGAARIAIEDAQQMARRGHRVVFLSACGQPPQNYEGIEWRSLGQKNILQEPRRWLAMSRGLWNFAAATELKKVLRQLPAQQTVIHLHSWSKALSGSVVRAAKSSGIPVVCTLHDYFVACPNGGLYDYPSKKVCTLTPMSSACIARNCDSRAYAHKIWRVVRQYVWRYLAGIPQDFAKMIAVSAFSEQKLRPYLLERPVAVIDNCPVLQRTDGQPQAKRYGVVYAGRVASEKGIEVYLAACQKIGLRAEIWGDGPDLAMLKQKWPSANYSGWLAQPELQSRLRSAMALVVPSLWYETYGLVVTEALAAGVAVIVSDHGAATGLVEDKVTGLHFRVGDVDDLAEKIGYVVDNPQAAVAMGKEGYQRFWDHYNELHAHRIEQIEKCYQEVAGVSHAA